MDGRGGVEELVETEGEKSIISIYFLRKNIFSIRGKYIKKGTTYFY